MKNLLLVFLLISINFGAQPPHNAKYTPPPPPQTSLSLNIGNIKFQIPSSFLKTEIKGELYNNLEPLFKGLDAPVAKYLYVLPKNNDVLMFTYSKTETDYNVGRNEGLEEWQISNIIKELQKVGLKGTLQPFKIKQFNAIKQSASISGINTNIYYLYDFESVLIFIINSTGKTDWKFTENQILSSFGRGTLSNNHITYPFFDLNFNLSKELEFVYTDDIIKNNKILFDELDKIAAKADLKNQIGSSLLQNSARVNSNIGGLMVVVNDFDFPLKNKDLVSNHTIFEKLIKEVNEGVDKDIPPNVDIIESRKALKYISPMGVYFVQKEVVAKKTNMLTNKVSFDTTLFLTLAHNNKLYRIHTSYRSEPEKKFIFDVIDNITMR